MKNHLLLALLITAVAAASCAKYLSREDDPAARYNEELLPFREVITEEFLHGHLSVIAHDSLQGRGTGMRGQKIAARYLSDFYRDLGFRPVGDNGTYFQHFDLLAERTDSLVYKTWRVTGGDSTLVNLSVATPGNTSDYIQLFGGGRPFNGQVVFAGFGVNDPARGVHHLEGTDLQNKWVMIFEDIPYHFEGDTLVDPGITYNERFTEIVSDNNANGVLIISNDTPGEFARLQRLDSWLLGIPQNLRLAYLGDRSAPMRYPKGYVRISPDLAAELLGLNSPEELPGYRLELARNIRKFTPYELPYHLEYLPYEGPTTVNTENVVALLEGSDPVLKEEVVVLTAHYDHIGLTAPDRTGDFINNGADDNGSGTVALMAVAQALHDAALEGIRPRRSILFLHVSAEEEGLLGSRYYSDHPIIPIDKTVANYNADMVGRSTTAREAEGDTDYIYIIGGEIISSELDSLVHEANRSSVNMNLDYTFNNLNDPNQFYRRSDHWNLGRLGVPFVFFFTGVHEDYHRPSDEIGRVDLPKLVRTSQLIYASTLQVANHTRRPVVDNQQFIEITRRRPR